MPAVRSATRGARAFRPPRYRGGSRDGREYSEGRPTSRFPARSPERRASGASGGASWPPQRSAAVQVIRRASPPVRSSLRLAGAPLPGCPHPADPPTPGRAVVHTTSLAWPRAPGLPALVPGPLAAESGRCKDCHGLESAIAIGDPRSPPPCREFSTRPTTAGVSTESGSRGDSSIRSETAGRMAPRSRGARTMAPVRDQRRSVRMIPA